MYWCFFVFPIATFSSVLHNPLLLANCWLYSIKESAPVRACCAPKKIIISSNRKTCTRKERSQSCGTCQLQPMWEASSVRPSYTLCIRLASAQLVVPCGHNQLCPFTSNPHMHQERCFTVQGAYLQKPGATCQVHKVLHGVTWLSNHPVRVDNELPTTLLHKPSFKYVVLRPGLFKPVLLHLEHHSAST